MRNKNQLIYPKLLLNFGNNRTEELNPEIIFKFHAGERFQYNGIVYNITDVKHHYKEGFAPYTEIMLSEDVEADAPLHICMYCGEAVNYGSNPADFIHYSDADVFGKKFVCPFCDSIITRTNRYFSSALEAKKNHDTSKMIFDLEQAVNHLNEAIEVYRE